MHVSTNGLSKRIGFRNVLTDVNITMEGGSVVTLLGANGTGKTTLLRLMGCIYTPTKGDIRFDGELLQRRRLDLRRRFMLIADLPSNPMPTTVVQYLIYVAALYGRSEDEIRSRAVELLEKWSLLPHSWNWVAYLSRGQAYKLQMACLELCDPELWLLDEPFASGMDPSGLFELRKAIADARSRGRTVLFTTQLAELAYAVSDRMIVLHKTRVALDGPVAEVLSASKRHPEPELQSLLRSVAESSHGGESDFSI